MKGVLVRVGIDTTSDSGHWNAPYDPQTKRFVYVPICEGDEDNLHPRLIRRYGEVEPALTDMNVALPQHLDGRPMHLDPDFKMLTYGDVPPRSKPLLDLKSGDFIVFYASLQPVGTGRQGFVYALIGFYAVKEVVNADDIPRERWLENAHTRRRQHGRHDVIVRGKKGVSGLFDRAIPIGEYRDRSYRVRKSILKEWGDLTVKNGYIQRSGRLPEFKKPEQFLKWFEKQGAGMRAANWA